VFIFHYISLAYWDDERGHEGECTALALLIYEHSRLKALAMEFNNALQQPLLMLTVLLARFSPCSL
jgi:hypothetical protein